MHRARVRCFIFSASHDGPVSISSTDAVGSSLSLCRWVGIPKKKGCFFARARVRCRHAQIPRRFSSVVLSRIVISRRGICVLSRLMREKRICQEFNQLGRTLIAEWQLSRKRPSGSLVVKHGKVFDTVLLTGSRGEEEERTRGDADTSGSHF